MHPDLEELLILRIFTRRSKSTITRTVRLRMTAINMSWSCQISANPPGSVFTPTALQAIWARSRTMAPSESVLLISPAAPPPPVFSLGFALFICPSSLWQQQLSLTRGHPSPQRRVPTMNSVSLPLKLYPSQTINALKSKSRPVSFGTGGLETCSLIAGKSIKLSQGGPRLHRPNDVNYKLRPLISKSKLNSAAIKRFALDPHNSLHVDICTFGANKHVLFC